MNNNSQKEEKSKMKAISILMAWIIFMAFRIPSVINLFSRHDEDAAFFTMISLILVSLALVFSLRKYSLRLLIPLSFFIHTAPLIIFELVNHNSYPRDSGGITGFICYGVILFLALIVVKLERLKRKTFIIEALFGLILIGVIVFSSFHIKRNELEQSIHSHFEYKNYEAIAKILTKQRSYLTPTFIETTQNKYEREVQEWKLFVENELQKNRDNFISVEGGSFFMTPEKDRGFVTLDGYSISKKEVTVNLYEAVMGFSNLYSQRQKDGMAKGSLSWNEAAEFCNILSEKDGLELCYTIDTSSKRNQSGRIEILYTIECDFEKNGYRMPTEAEWVYAALGGEKSRGYVFSGSDDYSDVANNSFIIRNRICFKTAQKSPNELGIFDMSGSLYEWCWDWAPESRHKELDNELGHNPKGPLSGEKKVTKGQSLTVGVESLTPYFTGSLSPDYQSEVSGLRLVRTIR